MFLYIVLFSIIFWIALTFNKFMASRQLVNEGWSDIDVQLKRKHDLIQTLVTSVKAYAKHEHTIFTEVTKQRTEMVTKQMIEKIFAIAENYPTLMASKNFLDLQKQLTETENTIANARKYYNGAVRNFNILIASFPANLLAKLFNQHNREFFQ